MSPGGRRLIVCLGLVAVSCAAVWVLMAMEMRLAPLPESYDEAVAGEGLNDLIASVWRWQLIYLPLLGLAMVIAAALLAGGRAAWLDATLAQSFVVVMVVMVQSTTVSWWNAALVALGYLVAGGLLAQLVRRARQQSAGGAGGEVEAVTRHGETASE